jgi:hypothetical protein
MYAPSELGYTKPQTGYILCASDFSPFYPQHLGQGLLLRNTLLPFQTAVTAGTLCHFDQPCGSAKPSL